MVDFTDDFIWTVVLTHITGKFIPGHGSFQYKLNCPMCLSRGETQDTKHRCGISRKSNGFGVNCFNCKFTCGFTLGKPLTRRAEEFLAGIGVAERQIKLLKLTAQEFVGIIDPPDKSENYSPLPSFSAVDLPPGSQTLNYWESLKCDDPNYLAVTDYLLSRGEVAVMASTYYWTPDTTDDFNRKLIIPCWHDGRLVGWIGRSIDPTNKRKYYNKTPPNFLFNSQILANPHRKYVIIVEGIFDALAIDAVAASGNSLNQQQIRWINQSGKTPIVVPDQDNAGKQLINIALKNGWAVAFPNVGHKQWWRYDKLIVKDVDDAVRNFGKLFTLRSIIESHTADRTKIEQWSGAWNLKSTIGSLSN